MRGFDYARCMSYQDFEKKRPKWPNYVGLLLLTLAALVLSIYVLGRPMGSPTAGLGMIPL